MRRFLWIVAALTPLLAAGCNNSSQADPVARMTRALGGREAIGRLHSLSVAANCIGPDGHFRTWVESVRPGSVHFRQSDGVDSIAVWSTPDSTWLSDGARMVEGDPRVRAFVRGHEFHLDLFEIDTRFSGHTVAGMDTVDGHACARVDMRDEGGSPAAIFIDEESGLPRLLELNPAGAEGTLRIMFDDWREVAGLMVFFAFGMAEGPDRNFIYRYTEIVPNQVPPGLFDPRQFR
ncbi:MAG: hypothetical protein OEY32_12255 [Candidatus Krumholzibacteria bacterium]|nr:hypothetical protein [Candidatus Krumholzibacteria bacterium]MDH5270681.1 hypothetical protein [Candidatus Krumholzibacteria bacterium]